MGKNLAVGSKKSSPRDNKAVTKSLLPPPKMFQHGVKWEQKRIIALLEAAEQEHKETTFSYMHSGEPFPKGWTTESVIALIKGEKNE